jgi:hypothetical protein
MEELEQVLQAVTLAVAVSLMEPQQVVTAVVLQTEMPMAALAEVL